MYTSVSIYYSKFKNLVKRIIYIYTYLNGLGILGEVGRELRYTETLPWCLCWWRDLSQMVPQDQVMSMSIYHHPWSALYIIHTYVAVVQDFPGVVENALPPSQASAHKRTTGTLRNAFFGKSWKSHLFKLSTSSIYWHLVFLAIIWNKRSSLSTMDSNVGVSLKFSFGRLSPFLGLSMNGKPAFTNRNLMFYPDLICWEIWETSKMPSIIYCINVDCWVILWWTASCLKDPNWSDGSTKYTNPSGEVTSGGRPYLDDLQSGGHQLRWRVNTIPYHLRWHFARQQNDWRFSLEHPCASSALTGLRGAIGNRKEPRCVGG